LIVEIFRLRRPVFQNWFEKHFGALFRSEEKTRLTGVFWMLLGVLAAGLLIPPPSVATAVLLFMILGDVVASLVGKSVGGPRWFRSPKHISGSLACFAVCVVMGAIFLRPLLPWGAVLLTSFTAAFLEVGYIPVNDNFLIPLGCSLVLNLVYGLRPVIF
jgi:dolichol kinase